MLTIDLSIKVMLNCQKKVEKISQKSWQVWSILYSITEGHIMARSVPFLRRGRLLKVRQSPCQFFTLVGTLKTWTDVSTYLQNLRKHNSYSPEFRRIKQISLLWYWVYRSLGYSNKVMKKIWNFQIQRYQLHSLYFSVYTYLSTYLPL